MDYSRRLNARYIDEAKTRWTNCNSGEFSGCDRSIASCPFRLGQLLPLAHPTKPARERQVCFVIRQTMIKQANVDNGWTGN
ncbi:hypothetical protein P0D68_11655 [Paraburkholderia sp. RL17-380-BIE-A]|uniref:hypothetical protein n=1 Tax=Paraburkholderia sp. RL17-380-BIE-A TaxID=3031630 RepID=UPI0038B7F1AF